MTGNILDVLRDRGFVKEILNEEGLRAKMSGESLTFYIGFDPTGDSLHVGHLVPIMCMRWLQKAGHNPIVVFGGGTAMVGDPSGKDKTREMLTAEKIDENLKGFRPIFEQFLDMDGVRICNNADWLLSLNYIAFLRDIGKHFSVNRMIKAEGTRQRLEREQGFSFIEFNYHLLQSYDFLYLHKTYGCSLQVGGDDQWFHLCGGSDLIRRETGAEAYGFTIPLLTTSTGKKMGKTEKGAVWLNADKCSVYDYYQYWVNVSDADVIQLMKLFTFMDMSDIAEYAHLQGADLRKAKARLAFEATALAHGQEEAIKVQKAAQAAFSGKSSGNMPTHTSTLPALIVNLIADTGLCKSRSDARRMVKGGAVKVDYGAGKEKVGGVEQQLEK
ncbi:MAG: tyrosine--tRNA ligase, partial [Myxococcota bacterium]|nr:tyrosine--tRNA ligase [Myxococcota bacterium]